MQETTQTATKTTAAPKPQTVKRKIGKTTYELSLHFSQTNTERMSDKVMRLLENDLRLIIITLSRNMTHGQAF